jgi:hypothetical protein
VRDDAEERYVSYAFLRQSGTQHGNLKVDLQNDFTTGGNRYPKNHQQTLHLLDKYSKTVVAKVTHSEGTSFTQKGGRDGGNRSSSGNKKGRDSSTYDKKYWNDKECYKCLKKGHPATHCPKKPSDNDDCSTASAASSVKKLKKDLKSIKKAFTTVDISPSSQPDRALSTLSYGLKPICNLSQSCYGRTPIACAHTTGNSNTHLIQVSYRNLFRHQYKQECNQGEYSHTQVYHNLNTHQLHLNAPCKHLSASVSTSPVEHTS